MLRIIRRIHVHDDAAHGGVGGGDDFFLPGIILPRLGFFARLDAGSGIVSACLVCRQSVLRDPVGDDAGAQGFDVMDAGVGGARYGGHGDGEDEEGD